MKVTPYPIAHVFFVCVFFKHTGLYTCNHPGKPIPNLICLSLILCLLTHPCVLEK